MNAAPPITWLQLTTLAIALVGAVLGVLTTWRTFSNDRVRLRVRPTTIFLPHTGAWCLGVEVVNLSSFAVTVDTIGFTMRDTTNHLQLMPLLLTSGDRLPKRLEPRTGFTALAAPEATADPNFDHAIAVYAKTACGEQITGGKRHLSDVLFNLQLAQHRRQ